MFLDDLIGGIIKPIVASVFPDPADKLKAQELQINLQEAIISNQAALEEAAAANVKTEAASKFWLAANWRPLTMLTFVALIVLRLVAALTGHTFVGVSDVEWDHLWSIVEVGIGGYTVGRTVEKVSGPICDAIKKAPSRN